MQWGVEASQDASAHKALNVFCFSLKDALKCKRHTIKTSPTVSVRVCQDAHIAPVENVAFFAKRKQEMSNRLPKLLQLLE